MVCEAQTHTGRVPCDGGGRGTGAVASQEHQTLLIPEAQGGYSPDFPPVSLREQGFTDTLGFLLLAPRIVR